MEITHHGIVFSIDTNDWSNSDSAQIAEDVMAAGIQKLSANDVRNISNKWIDGDAECESRNENDEIAVIVKEIENSAYKAATAGWVSIPENGHNCYISVAQCR